MKAGTRQRRHLNLVTDRVIFSQDTYCGGYSGEDPPLPIPNREVKLTIADGTAPPGGRVGSCHALTRSFETIVSELFLYNRVSVYRYVTGGPSSCPFSCPSSCPFPSPPFQSSCRLTRWLSMITRKTIPLKRGIAFRQCAECQRIRWQEGRSREIPVWCVDYQIW